MFVWKKITLYLNFKTHLIKTLLGHYPTCLWNPEASPKGNWGLTDSPMWLHEAPGQGHIINTKLGLWDQRASLASPREQWALLNPKSQQRGAQHGEVCLLSESSHPGPASLCWRGVTSAHSDLHTINTDWEPTQRNSFLSESTSQSWKHSGRKKFNCFPLSLPEDYPFVSTWSRRWLLTLEPAHCLNSWNKVREKHLLLNASQ